MTIARYGITIRILEEVPHHSRYRFTDEWAAQQVGEVVAVRLDRETNLEARVISAEVKDDGAACEVIMRIT